MFAHRALPAALGACLLLTFTGGLAGCGEGRGANAPSRDLSAYTGRATALFDDSIEPAAVGLDYDRGYTPKGDPFLRERSQTGDAVLRVRVTTVTGLGSGADASYRVSFSTIEKLAGDHPPPSSFTLVFDRSSESHGILRSFETRLVGYPFIAFVRAFAPSGTQSGGEGEPVLHFHLAPDTKDVRAAVEEAIVLEVLK